MSQQNEAWKALISIALYLEKAEHRQDTGTHIIARIRGIVQEVVR